MQVTKQTNPVLVILHVTGVVVGGYIFCACLTVLVSAMLVLFAGQARGDVVLWMTMLSFLLYLALLIWGFATSPGRVWAWLTMGVVVCGGLFLYLNPRLAAHLSGSTL